MYHLFLIVLGLMLFFLGLNLFKKFALNQTESRLNNLIEKTIKNNLNAFFVGIIATFVVQSSSSIISITICLVSCNLLKYKHALAIVLGSNIGTCFNSFIYALNVFDYSYIIVIIGLLMALFNIKNYQYFLDIGFVFYGLFLIENGMDFFASSESFRRVLFSSNNPFYAFLISGILSGIIQSSSVIIV